MMHTNEEYRRSAWQTGEHIEGVMAK